MKSSKSFWKNRGTLLACMHRSAGIQQTMLVITYVCQGFKRQFAAEHQPISEFANTCLHAQPMLFHFQRLLSTRSACLLLIIIIRLSALYYDSFCFMGLPQFILLVVCQKYSVFFLSFNSYCVTDIIFWFSVILKYRMPSFITICPQLRPCEGIQLT